MQLLEYNVKNVIHSTAEKYDEVGDALKGLGLWYLTPLSTIFQLYRGGNALMNSEKLLVLYVKML